MEAERKLLKDEKFTGWAVIWTLFAFKMATVVVIMIVGANSSDRETGEAMAYIVSTTWYWFLIPIIAFSGFIAWRLRLRAARKNVSRLRQAEFSVQVSDDSVPLTADEIDRLRQVRHLPEHER